MNEKIDAIVIRCVACGKSDRMLTVMSRDAGKISVFAKYAQNAKNRLHSATNLFVASQMLVDTKLEIRKLQSCEIVNDFAKLSTKLSNYYCACFIAETVLKVLGENQAESTVFSLLYYTLLFLNEAKEEQALLFGVCFLAKFLAMQGAYFDFSLCHLCAGPIQGGCRLSFDDGAVYCMDCVGDAPALVQVGAKTRMLYARLVHENIEDVHKLQGGDGRVMRQLFSLLYNYLSYTYQVQIKSFSVLESLI